MATSLNPNGPGGCSGSGSPAAKESIIAIAMVQEGRWLSLARGAACQSSANHSVHATPSFHIGEGGGRDSVRTGDVFPWQLDLRLCCLRSRAAVEEFELRVSAVGSQLSVRHNQCVLAHEIVPREVRPGESGDEPVRIFGAMGIVADAEVKTAAVLGIDTHRGSLDEVESEGARERAEGDNWP